LVELPHGDRAGQGVAADPSESGSGAGGKGRF
jgi:hypothetical protein